MQLDRRKGARALPLWLEVASFGPVPQCLPKQSVKRTSIAGFALPNDVHFPPSLLKSHLDSLIPCYVPFELRPPESNSGLGHIRESASSMPVPEASVNQKNRAVAREDNIRLTWKVTSMQTESISHPVQRSANRQLRDGIPTAYARHHGASLLRGENVHVGPRRSNYHPGLR